MEEKILKPLVGVSTTPQPIKVDPTPSDNSVTLNIPEGDVVETGDAKPQVTQQDYRTSPLFYQVAEYFGVDSHEYEDAKNKLSAIVDWAAESSKSSNVEDILLKLRETEEKVARLDPFEKRYKMMFRYVMLKGKEASIQKSLKAFEKGGV